MKHIPEGQGIWIAFPTMLGLSPPALATMLRLSGFDWVAPRGSDGAYEDKAWTAAHTKACNDVGLKVYRWPFSRPRSWEAEIELAHKWKDEGDSGFIIDAEIAWEIAGSFDTCKRYMTGLDARLGSDYFIADAPWPYVSFHWAIDKKGLPVSGFPFHIFAERCDARMPQVYWTEINNKGAPYNLALIDAQWAKFDAMFPALARPFMPIGITYGRKEIAKWGGAQLPPGEITPEDVAYFDNRYRGGTRSYYSREAASDAVVKKLAELCARTFEVQPTHPDGPANPLGRETRAEWDADETAREETRMSIPREDTPPLVASLEQRIETLDAGTRASMATFLTRNHGRHGT